MLVEIYTVHSYHAKERIAYVHILGIVVSVRVPDTTTGHFNAAAALLTTHGLCHELVPEVVELFTSLLDQITHLLTLCPRPKEFREREK